LVLLTHGFGHKSLITSSAPQREASRREENLCDLSQEFDRENSCTTIETDFQSDGASFAVMQRDISAIAEGFKGKLERILSEPERMTQFVKQSSTKHSSDQRACIKALTEWVAVKSTSFR
jgi:hypothetical protein